MKLEVRVGAQGAGGFLFERFLSKAGEGFVTVFASLARRERASLERERG